jgi:predicted MFS family arabinose efflux permease
LRLLPPGTLRARAGLPAAIAVLALVNFAFFAVEAFLPLALTEVRSAGMTWVAAALTAGTLAWTSGSWIQARAASRMPRRRLLGGGVALLFAGAVGATAILSSAVPAAASVVAWAVAGLGIGIAYPSATIAILEAAPAGREGEVSSTMQIANALAIALGTGLGGDLVARVAHDGASPALGIGLVDVASIAACALAWVAVRGVSEPKPAPPPAA